MVKSINTLLIANRGEIAVRIIKTARRLGIMTVAVFSEPDANALHVKLADRAVALGGCTPLESYASVEKLIDAGKKSRADAVHPGYGFLSENADFARACQERGIVFIGPSADAIDSMGHKSRAKELVAKAGVPLLAGYSGAEQSLEFLLERGKEIGFPLMIKAASGGGGRGMRIANDAHNLRDLLISARAEAERAFGAGDLLLERALLGARHVEVQIFGDAHGNVVHMAERDCSIQRRHQKVIEESPCPQVSEALRMEMGDCAVRAAKAIDYEGAGTVEFLLDRDNKFYFLEMNTRLQVEHPVTECVTGLDLVEWQIRVAGGEKLPLSQDQIRLQGHAIEARLYAENPDDAFQPQIGEIVAFSPSSDELVRTDHGLNSRDAVSPYYDAMLAKVIAFGSDREIARRRLMQGLRDSTVFGIDTNRQFLLDCLQQESFVNGDFDTGFIETFWKPKEKCGDLDANLLAIAAAILTWQNHDGSDELAGWSSTSVCNSLMKLEVKGADVFNIDLKFLPERTIEFRVRDETRVISNVVFSSVSSGAIRTVQCFIDGGAFKASFVMNADELHISALDRTLVIEDVLFKPRAETGATASDGALVSPCNGLLASVEISVGDPVEQGAPLFTVEAMKLLQTIRAPFTGTVSAVLAEAGQQIKSKQLIVQIASADQAADETTAGATKKETLAIH